MSDNVTPFRRPKPVRPQQRGGLGFKTHRGKVLLVHLLTIATYVSAFLFPFPAPPGSPIILVIASCISLALAFATIALAMPNRYEGMPWASTHHEHAIRTLIIGFVLWTLSSALTYINAAFFAVAFWSHLIIMIWAIARAGAGLVLGVMRKPIPNPRGWIV